MLFFSDTEDIARAALAVLVAIEMRRTGKKEVAYDDVAQLIGSSSSWLQKYLRDTGEVRSPCPPLLLRICAAYDQLCDRVEQENKRDEQRLRQLKDKIDAAAAGATPKNPT